MASGTWLLSGSVKMVERRSDNDVGPTEFVYRDIELFKRDSLGSGSYGGVCKAKCDGLLCAAKIMHPTLFDLRDPGAVAYLRKFREECHLLSLARHPNVVQYLATYCDPDTQQPVILMELCDESLTAFLERSLRPLPYHLQVNICHDISLALVYLHSNHLIHRDLTGNNVLMVAGTRAKVTDFGMSKLANVNPQMTALTLCPGNMLYMSPESLDESKLYTAKLDIFSLGVIGIQIITMKFPNPSDRFRMVYVAEFDEMLRREIPEIERRKNHIDLIPDTHPLKPITMECLKKENERPSALQLSEILSELKQLSVYTESVLQAQSNGNAEQDQLQFQNFKKAETKKCEDLQAKITELEKILVAKDRKIHEQQLTINALQPKAQKDITKMQWKECINAPEVMCRGAVAVRGTTAYFRPAGSNRVYSYQTINGKEQWFKLPENAHQNFGLAVIDNHVTSVGGEGRHPVGVLLSLTQNGLKKEWSAMFPAMPTPRSSAACNTTEKVLVVTGGLGTDSALDTVEVMNISTKQWAAISSLPESCWLMSSVVCGDTLYLAGGASDSMPSESVFACSLQDLLPSSSTKSRSASQKSTIWKHLNPLPVTSSTLAFFNNHLLAIGGRDKYGNPTSNVYIYTSYKSWSVINTMNHEQSLCLAVTFPHESVVVVGGVKGTRKTNNIETLI